MELKTLGLALAIATGLADSQTQTAARPSFEVASVKANKSNERLDYRSEPGGRRFMVRNMPAKGLIQIAYRIKDFQIAGGAGWLSSDGFDIDAFAEHPTSLSQLDLMLRSLLADRFKLKLHREVKESSAYALVMGKDGEAGLKMKLSADQTAWYGDFPDGAPDGRPVTGGGPKELGPGRVVGEAIPISMLTNFVSSAVGRIVINKSGLTGRYDVDLHYAPNSGQAGDAPEADPAATSFFTAIQQQLGLRLESIRAPVEVFVIDHIEKPSEN